MNRSLLADRILGAILLATAIFLGVMTLTFPAAAQRLDPGTAALPRLVAIGLGVLSLLLLVKPEPAEGGPEPGRRRVLSAAVLATAVFALAIEPLGFPLAAAGYTLVGLLLMGVRKPLPLVLYPIVLALGLHLLFTVALSVYLPAGPLEGMLP